MTTVHLVFKTHLDLGFTDLARNVEQRYFEHFIPQAVALARSTRERNVHRFRWTVGSWLIYEYLERASAEQRREMEQAIAAGDIVWHALPFTPHCEFMGKEMFRFGLSLSQRLDQRFGKKTIAAKMTDVPGHTRGIVPLLAEAGVEFLHIGVNEASAVPDVPPVFVWRDEPSGTQIVVAYNGSYGDAVTVNGLDDVLALSLTGDNHGPQTDDGVALTYIAWRKRYPRVDTEIIASTMDDFAVQLREVRRELPVVTSEIGDTWIHGVGSDPLKVAQYRELNRLWQGWAKQKATDRDALDAFARRLMLVPEHTWGLDVKTHLGVESYHHYGVTALQEVCESEAHQKMEESWSEQRAYIDQAQHRLHGTRWAREVVTLTSQKPQLDGYIECNPADEHDTMPFKVRFGEHGEITSLVSNMDGRTWFTPAYRLGMLRYETYSVQDYNHFWQRYNRNKDRADVVWWASQDFTKAGMGSEAKHQRIVPHLKTLWRQEKSQRFLMHLTFHHLNNENYRPAQDIWQIVSFENTPPAIHFDIRWFDKLPTRLPEAYWWSTEPLPFPHGLWLLDKLGTQIDARDVVSRGNRQMHAVEAGVTYEGSNGAMTIQSYDAPLVCVGKPALLDFSDELPDPNGGVHFNLYNNTWATNFRMWYGDDARFRFAVRLPVI
jgi:hypothetical protein